YGGSETGQFFRVDIDPRNPNFLHSTTAKDTTGKPSLIFPPTQVSVPDLFTGNPAAPGGNPGTPIFSGLSRGPLDLNNGQFANDFFATTSDGKLVCLDANGTPLQVFDRNGDGIADSFSVQLRSLTPGS